LNDQKPGDLAALFSNKAIVVNHVESLTGKDKLTQRVIRNGWTSARICPISLKTGERQKHAATSTREESGAFDGLRARLVQVLGDTDLGKIVNSDHPNLLTNVLEFINQFLNEPRFSDIRLGYSEMLNLVRQDGSMQSWDGLSGGEQSALNLAMAIEFSKVDNSLFLIIEEPETNLHPCVQRQFLEIIKNHLPNRQIFISTHSPYIFEKYLDSSNLIIGKYSDTGTVLENPDYHQWLFSSVSWGELSFHAFNLPTFEPEFNS
jgi:hypothetical protein